MTQSAEPIIEMLSKFNIEKFEPIIFNLIKKENLIPKAWLGELNEDSKYWCSLVALKCIVNKKDNKYLDYYDERLNMYLFLNMKENDKENILNSKLVYNNNKFVNEINVCKSKN